MMVNQVSPWISTLHLGTERPLDTPAISIVHISVQLTAVNTALQVVEMGYGRRVFLHIYLLSLLGVFVKK